jgi:hypothetical protein
LIQDGFLGEADFTLSFFVSILFTRVEKSVKTFLVLAKKNIQKSEERGKDDVN